MRGKALIANFAAGLLVTMVWPWPVTAWLYFTNGWWFQLPGTITIVGIGAFAWAAIGAGIEKMLR